MFAKQADYRPSYAKVHYNGQVVDRSDAADYAAQVQRMNELILLQQQQQRNAGQVAPVYGNGEVVYNGYAKTS